MLLEDGSKSCEEEEEEEGTDLIFAPLLSPLLSLSALNSAGEETREVISKYAKKRERETKRIKCDAIGGRHKN